MEREMLMFEEYLAKKTTTSIIYTYSCLSLLPSFRLFTRRGSLTSLSFGSLLQIHNHRANRHTSFGSYTFVI